MKRSICLILFLLLASPLLTSCGKQDVAASKELVAPPNTNLTNFVEIPLVAPKPAPKIAKAASLPSDQR